MAQGDGPALGRELEFAELLPFIKRAGIRNTVWLTADVHYTAAHYYDPNKAQFQDFEPFWEFVSGPAACRHVRSERSRQYVRAAAALREGAEPRMAQNLPPSADMQFFGHVAIDGASEVMTVTLKDWNDQALWSTKLEPKVA